MGMESSYWPLESPNQWGANNLEIVEETISTSPLASWKHHQLPYVPLLLGLAGLLGGALPRRPLARPEVLNGRFFGNPEATLEDFGVEDVEYT